MKEFKKLPKMACGGKVKKYSEGKTVVKEGADIPTYKNQMYWEEPSTARKVGMALGDAADKVYQSVVNTLSSKSALRQPTVDSMKNAADKKKRGGKVKRK